MGVRFYILFWSLDINISYLLGPTNFIYVSLQLVFKIFLLNLVLFFANPKA